MSGSLIGGRSEMHFTDWEENYGEIHESLGPALSRCLASTFLDKDQ